MQWDNNVCRDLLDGRMREHLGYNNGFSRGRRGEKIEEEGLGKNGRFEEIRRITLPWGDLDKTLSVYGWQCGSVK